MLNPIDVVLRITPLPPIKNLDDLDANPPASPPILIEGILHQGSKMIMGGGSKGRKSWMLMDLAVCVSEGLEWWGFSTVKTTVLHLNFELQEHFAWSRFDWIKRERGQERLPNLKVWNLRGHSAGMEALEDQLNAEMGQHQVGMLILDPLYKVLGDTDENDNSKIGQLMNRLESIAVHNQCAVVFAHHFRKGGPSDSGSSMDRMSGAGTLARDPDAILTMQDLDEEDCVVVEPVLRNCPPIPPFGLRWECPLFKPESELELDKVKGRAGPKAKYQPEQAVSALIGCGSWVDETEAKKLIGKKLGCSPPTAKNLLDKAVGKELLKHKKEDSSDLYLTIT